MAEIKLKDEDYNAIADLVLKRFMNDSPRKNRNFMVQCYIETIVMYFNSKGYVVKDGKILKDE